MKKMLALLLLVFVLMTVVTGCFTPSGPDPDDGDGDDGTTPDNDGWNNSDEDVQQGLTAPPEIPE